MSEGAAAPIRFRALDGWRGICALMVALSHLPVTDHFHRLPWVRANGFYVDFFFVLSGFVIANGYAGRITDWATLGDFVRRRFARLWPLHMACFAALFALRLAVDHLFPSFVLVAFDPLPTGMAAVSATILNVTLLQGVVWHPGWAVVPPSWSISTEFYTYLVFGLICLAAVWRPRFRVAAAILIVIVGIAVLARFSRGGMEDTTAWSIFRCLAEFFIGVLAWQCWRAGWAPRLGGTAAEIGAVALVGLYILIAYRLPGLGYLSPLVFASVILIFASERGVVSRGLRSRPAEKLGRWSYSIYLTHSIVAMLAIAAIQFAERFDHGFARIAIVPRGASAVYSIAVAAPAGDVLSLLYLAAVIALSAATYAAIELPGQRLGRRARPLAPQPHRAPNPLT